MTRLNPCVIFPGASLTVGVFFIALLCGFGWLGMVFFCLKEYDVHTHSQDGRGLASHYMMADDTADTYFYTGMFALTNNIFSLVLWFGALKRSRNLCLLWFAESTIVAAVLAARVLFYDILYYRVEAGLLLFYLYSLWVVWEFFGQKIEPERRRVLPITVTRPQTQARRGANAVPIISRQKIRLEKEVEKFTEQFMKKWMEARDSQGTHPYFSKPMVMSSV